MRMRLHSALIVALMAMGAAACGSGSPTSPSNGGIASVTFAGSSVSAGAAIQGTVTLANAAGSAGASVGLSSSNPAVATVPASIPIASGATTGTFSVTGVSAGTATITATMNGSSKSSAVMVSAGSQLASISVTPSTAVGGSNVTVSVTLGAPAPSGGALVTLAGEGPVIVPPSVTVAAGSTSASLALVTQVVGAPTTATIRGSYGGATMTATVALTRPTVPVANFGVTGPNVTDTCAVINGGTALDCTFNGSTSGAPGTITAYDWTWGVTGSPKTQTTAGPVLANPAFSCSMLPAPPLPSGGSLTMTVTLQIHDDTGNVSAVTKNTGVRLLPQGSCGY